jgi:hypothetical protein
MIRNSIKDRQKHDEILHEVYNELGPDGIQEILNNMIMFYCPKQVYSLRRIKEILDEK